MNADEHSKRLSESCLLNCSLTKTCAFLSCGKKIVIRSLFIFYIHEK